MKLFFYLYQKEIRNGERHHLLILKKIDMKLNMMNKFYSKKIILIN